MTFSESTLNYFNMTAKCLLTVALDFKTNKIIGNILHFFHSDGVAFIYQKRLLNNSRMLTCIIRRHDTEIKHLFHYILWSLVSHFKVSTL